MSGGERDPCGEAVARHALDLLAGHVPLDAAGAVHLDLACGSGRVASEVVSRHGLTYIGVDSDREVLGPLAELGLETHVVDLAEDGVAASLAKILDGRRVAAITFLDGLTRLADGAPVLAAIGDLLASDRAIGILAVPNATHVEVGIATLLGRGAPADSMVGRGLQTRWSAAILSEELARAGLHPVASRDLDSLGSARHPGGHAALGATTPVDTWLRAQRQHVDPYALTTRFVWAVAPVPPRGPMEGLPEDSEPFLSVLMRTQGRRPQELREALLCLAAQSCTDFEVLLLAHRTSAEERDVVHAVLHDQPRGLRDRIRPLFLEHGSRSAPLNLGLSRARGRYVAVFDDDDLALGHWVNSFLLTEKHASGRILRGVTLRQDSVLSTVAGCTGVRAVHPPQAVFAQDFSLTQHLVLNQSPPIGWVFPRSLHRDLGLSFDDSMTTTEDWDFLLRAAELSGVTDIPEVLAIYRWWEDRETSRTVHPAAEWLQNQQEIERRLDARPFLLPAGETRVLRGRLQRLETLEQEIADRELLIAAHTDWIAELEGELGAITRREGALLETLEVERRRRARLTRRLRQAGVEPPSAPPRSAGERAPGFLRGLRRLWSGNSR